MLCSIFSSSFHMSVQFIYSRVRVWSLYLWECSLHPRVWCNHVRPTTNFYLREGIFLPMGTTQIFPLLPQFLISVIESLHSTNWIIVTNNLTVVIEHVLIINSGIPVSYFCFWQLLMCFVCMYPVRVDDLSFFGYLGHFCFLLIEFHWAFSISYKILQYFVYYYYILIRVW